LGTLPTVPIAVIAFDFDPLLRLGEGLIVRWQTVALAAVIAACLLVAGVLGRRDGLRADDLLYITVGVVPGAVIGGRIGYALAHLDHFAGQPATLIDPAVGGLDLAAGVLGGVLTGAYVASLLGAPIGRWARALTMPLLVALGAGKLTMVLGGSGQGLPFDGDWATSYLGPGPWGSLAPALPSHPSQVYEGITLLGLTLVLIVVLWVGAFGRSDGRLLLIGLAAWSFMRAAVSTTWRDPAVTGPLGAAGLLALLLGVGWLVALGVSSWRMAGRRADGAGSGDAAADVPSWPDPETRPRF
jgi:phosphatidylglycerol:prolipoprotein diacylglycerol transferase